MKKLSLILRIISFLCLAGVAVLVFMWHPPLWEWYARFALLVIGLIAQMLNLILLFVQSRKKDQ